MVNELKKAADAVHRAQDHVVESQKELDPDSKARDELEEVELGLKWISNKITRVIEDQSE